MITTAGTDRLLEAQRAYLAACYWGLWVNLAPVDNRDMTLAVLGEATWAGYARQLVGAWGASVEHDGDSYIYPDGGPVFNNSSGATQTFRGWCLIDPAGLRLDAYDEISGSSVLIPNGGRYQLAPAAVMTGI